MVPSQRQKGLMSSCSITIWAAKPCRPHLAVVNPNRQDEENALGYLCAAGVVFLMLVEAMGRQLREAGAAGPDLMAMLDLVALGDGGRCRPLDRGREPRLSSGKGLKVMARRAPPWDWWRWPDVSRMTSSPDQPYHLGFVWAHGSMRAAVSVRPTWARGCCPQLIPHEARSLGRTA